MQTHRNKVCSRSSRNEISYDFPQSFRTELYNFLVQNGRLSWKTSLIVLLPRDNLFSQIYSSSISADFFCLQFLLILSKLATYQKNNFWSILLKLSTLPITYSFGKFIHFAAKPFKTPLSLL